MGIVIRDAVVVVEVEDLMMVGIVVVEVAAAVVAVVGLEIVVLQGATWSLSGPEKAVGIRIPTSREVNEGTVAGEKTTGRGGTRTMGRFRTRDSAEGIDRSRERR